MNITKKTRTVIVSIVGAITVLALVVAGIIFIPQWMKEPTTEDIIKDSAVGEQILGITDVNGQPAASIVIAPPTEEWWWVLGTYTVNPVAYGLDFNKYNTDSKYISYTLSPGGDYLGYGYLGLPTTFIVYNSDESAKKAADLLVADGVSHQLIGDIIFFVPVGAYSDVNYALNQYEAATSEKELELDGKAMMFMQYKSIKTFVDNSAQSDLYRETFDTLSGMLGLTEDSSWSGTSEDGLHWEGEFSGVDVEALNSPTDIQNYLSTRVYMLDENTQEWVLVPLEEMEPQQEIGGIMENDQALMFSSGELNIRSNTEVAGPKTESGNDIIKPLPESEGAYQINFTNFNAFLATIIGPDALTGYTTFASVSITIQEDGTSTMDVTLDESILTGEGDESTEESAENSSETTETEETAEG